MKSAESRVADYFVVVSAADDSSPLSVPTEDPILDVVFCTSSDAQSKLPSRGYEVVTNMAGAPALLKRGISLFVLRDSALAKHNLSWSKGYVNDMALIHGSDQVQPGWDILRSTTTGQSADLNRQGTSGKEVFLAIKRAERLVIYVETCCAESNILLPNEFLLCIYHLLCFRNMRQRYHAVCAVTSISIVTKGESVPPSCAGDGNDRNSYNMIALDVGAKVNQRKRGKKMQFRKMV